MTWAFFNWLQSFLPVKLQWSFSSLWNTEETSEELPNFSMVLIQQATKIKPKKTCKLTLWLSKHFLVTLEFIWLWAFDSQLSLKPKYKMWRVFDRPIYHNKRLLRADPCCRSVIKEFAHAFSCAYIELWMHLGSLESTQKARVALGCASSYSYAFFVLSKLPACIHNSIYAR